MNSSLSSNEACDCWDGAELAASRTAIKTCDSAYNTLYFVENFVLLCTIVSSFGPVQGDGVSRGGLQGRFPHLPVFMYTTHYCFVLHNCFSKYEDDVSVVINACNHNSAQLKSKLKETSQTSHFVAQFNINFYL